MLLNEIFSRKKKLFREILSQKLLNQTTYEKSYIRRASGEFTSICLLDNCRALFSITKRILRQKRKGRIKNFRKFELKSKKKNKKNKKKPKQKETKRTQQIKKDRKKMQIRIKNRSRKVKIEILATNSRNPYKKRDARIKRLGYKGSSSYTTTFLYQNRRIHLMRFKQPICNLVRSTNFVDLFLKGLKHLLTGRIKRNESTLIVLEAKRGGFSCYSSGFRAFISKCNFRRVVRAWARGIKRHIKKSGNLVILKQFIKSQRFQWSISPPPRFKFFIKTLVQYHRFRKNKSRLSRKKKTEMLTKMLPKFIFISKKYTFEKRKPIVEILFDKHKRAADGWQTAFKSYLQKCKAFDKK